jgi:hypothetical protein
MGDLERLNGNQMCPNAKHAETPVFSGQMHSCHVLSNRTLYADLFLSEMSGHDELLIPCSITMEKVSRTN